jgi:hypothetical protein
LANTKSGREIDALADMTWFLQLERKYFFKKIPMSRIATWLRDTLQPDYNQEMQYLRFLRYLPIAKCRNQQYLRKNEDFGMY